MLKNTHLTTSWLNNRVFILFSTIFLSLLSVWTIALVLPEYHFGVLLSHYRVNANWEDEIMYTQSAKSFKKYGLKVGHFGANEYVAPLKLSHFGVHGPFFPIVMGATSKIFEPGNDEIDAPRVNLIWISLGIIIFLLLAKLDFKKSLLFLAMISTYWPIHLFVASGGQEALHISIGLVVAGLICWLWREEEASFLKITVVLFGLFLFSLTRLNWALLFVVPLCLSNLKKVFSVRYALQAIASILLILFSIRISRFVSVPFPKEVTGFQFFKLLYGEQESSVFFKSFIDNAKFYFSCFSALHSRVEMLQLVHRVEIVGIILLSGGCLWFSLKKSKLPVNEARDFLFHIYSLGAMLFFLLLTYFVGNFQDYRVLSGPLVLSLCLLLARGNKIGFKAVGLCVLLNLSCTTFFLLTYRIIRTPNFTYNSEELNRFSQFAQKKMAYSGAENAWCDTLLTLGTYPKEIELFSAIPAGIGWQPILSPIYLSQPIKSRYVWINHNNFRSMFVAKGVIWETEKKGDIYNVRFEHLQMRLQKLESFYDSVLYLNLDADCHET